LFGADARAWVGNLLEREEAPRGPQLVVVELRSSLETIEEEVISVRNCEIASEQEFEFERVRSFQHQFILPEDLAPEVSAVLLASLEQQYGFQQDQEVERRYMLRMSAGANSGADYQVEWQAHWREGDLVVTWEDGEEDRVPYRALTDLEFFFQSSQEVRCP
jgi:hypothetical protein